MQDPCSAQHNYIIMYFYLLVTCNYIIMYFYLLVTYVCFVVVVVVRQIHCSESESTSLLMQLPYQ